MIKNIKKFLERITKWLQEKDCSNCAHRGKLSLRNHCDACMHSGYRYWAQNQIIQTYEYGHPEKK